MIQGKSVDLKIIEKADIELIRKWRNSPEVYNYMLTRDSISKLQQESWFQQVTKSRNAYYMMIYTKQNDKIGLVYFSKIDYRNKNAEPGLYIGSIEHRNSLYGLEAYYLLLDYGFSVLNLHKVYGRILSENELAIKMNKAFGFRTEGVLREEVFYNNSFHNIYRVSVLKDEFYDSRMAKFFK